jgi:hypothetical protein
MQAMEPGAPGFRELLERNEDVVRRIGAKLEAVFDPWAGLERTDLAFERLGLGATVK